MLWRFFSKFIIADPFYYVYSVSFDGLVSHDFLNFKDLFGVRSLEHLVEWLNIVTFAARL